MNFATRTLTAAAIAAAASFSFAADGVGESLKEAGRDVKDAAKDAKNAVMGDGAANNNPANAQLPTLPAGFKAKEANDIEDVRTGLVKLVNNTLTKGDFDDGVGYLTNDDRDRVKGQIGNSYADLDGRIDQFRALFKQKYGEDFKLTREVLDGVVSVQQGEVTDEATARKGWPVQPMAAAKAADAPSVNADPKLTNGRDVAIAHIAGMKDKSGLLVSMQHEMPDSWVVDVPSSVNGQALYKAQIDTLQKLIDKADAWPTAKEDAYRTVAEKVIKAYYSDDAAERPEMR